MAAPPNLRTNHADNISEIITAATINELAASVNNVGNAFTNILDYPGIDKTGATSSSVGIQNALNAAAGTSAATANVYVPAGRYLITTPLTLPDHVTLRGPLAGRGEWWASTGKGAVFVNNGNVDTIVGAGGSNASLASVIEGIGFEGTGTGAHVRVPDGSNNLAIRHCSMQGKANAIVMAGTVYDVYVDTNFFQGQTGANVLLTNSTGVGGTGIHILNNYFRQGTVVGLQIAGTTTLTDLSVVGNTFAGFTGNNVHHLDAQINVSRCLVMDNHFEGPSGAGSFGIFCVQGQGWVILSNQVTNMPNGMSLALFSQSIIGGNRFSSMSGNSIVIPNDGSAQNWIMPNVDASSLGISDLSGGSVRSNANGGMSFPVTAVGPGGAGVNLGSGAVGVANPRAIFYDDNNSASYVSEDASGQLHVRATGQIIFDIVPTGATRFSASVSPPLVISTTALGFFTRSSTPVGQQATAATATDLPTVITLANALKTALTNLGLTN